MGKGYQVSHQKVSVSISLSGKIRGYTELTIIPTTPDLRTVWLNARSLNILSTSLRVPTSLPLAFSYLPPLPPTLTEPKDMHNYPELKRAIWRATNEGEEGELGIGLPQGCVVKVQNQVAGATPATPKEEAKKEDEWEQIVIAVEYEVVRPGAGVVVVGPDEANPSRFPHVFTSSAADTSARTWVPCSDMARERCTWELELIAPRLLHSSSSSSSRQPLEDDDLDLDLPPEAEEGDEEWPITVVASGELIEQVVHPDRSDRVIWHYMQASPVSVQQIAWAVGPFVITEIAGKAKERERGLDDEDEDEDEIVKDEGAKLHALCLPGREVEMAHSVGVIRQAMDYYTSTFGSYPFSTYTVAFVDALASGAPTFHSAAMTLFSSDILHPPNIIDQAYETRQLLAHALAVQWSGVNLIPKAPADYWLVIGIALHITSLFLKTLWGNNEYRFRLKKDMIRCVTQDVQREPISVTSRPTQPEHAQLQFIALKAPLVLHILDKHLRKSGTSLGLDKVLPKLFLDAITGEIGSSSAGPLFNNLTTTSFMRTCRKACGGSAESLKGFFDQWVYGSGCPTFTISAMFNRKKMAVELNVKQECLAYNWAQTAPWEEAGHVRPIPLFDGQMTIRIHEADGTPYEHVLNIQEQFKRHEVPFNTKYKRVRRNTKRYQARQAAATAAASGDADAQEDIGMIDVGFSLTLWEEEKERDKWRVADWDEKDDALMNQATYEWIRIDADLEWICGIKFEQPDFMWLSQLQRDRDVVAQLEAVHALSRMPTAIVSSNLTKTVLVDNYFFRIRMEAALALIACATKAHDHLGLFHLFKLFQSRYCFEPDVETSDPFGFRCIPKTNDFRDFTEYFLKKTLLTAISMVRDERGQTPPVVQQFLVDLLAYNDNLGDPFSDTFYLTAIMNALGHALVTVAPREMGQFTEQNNFEEVQGNAYLQSAIEEIERYMSADRLVPSYHNAITISGIEWKTKLTMASLIPVDRMEFFCYTRDGNYPPVRIAAFDALLLFNPLQDDFALVRYFFAVMCTDSSRLVQRRLAESLLLSLPVLAAVQDLAAPEMVFEEEGSSKKEKDPLTMVLKALRKRTGRSNNFRQAMLDTLTHPDVDPEVRHCLLKICEDTVRASAEPLPKMRLRVGESAHPTPALTMPQLPKIKLTSTAPASYAIPKIVLAPRSAGPTTPQPAFDYLPEQLFQLVEPPTPRKIKMKAPPKLEQAQASGMEMSDVAVCKSLINKLLKSKNSHMFRAPVDPVKSGAPGYFDIVKNPMDISTLTAKLPAGQYSDRYAFREDFKLIISNARLYNRAGIVVEQADKLDAFFDKQWERVEATLRKMDTSGTPHFAEAASLPPITFSRPASPPAQTSYLPPPAPYVPPPDPYVPPPAPTYTPVPAFTASPAPTPAAAPAPAFVCPPSPLPAPILAPSEPVASTSKGVTFKLKPMAPYDSPTPPPPPSADPVKPKGFKITLGGSSLSQASPPPPVVKPPKAPKPPRIASFSDDAEYGRIPSSVSKPKDVSLKVKTKKGKEKAPISYAEEPEFLPLPTPPLAPEIVDLPPLPPPSKWVNYSGTLDEKKAKSVLKKMWELRESFFFQYPVEAVGALATYYDEIKEPMDLETMGRKLDRGHYRNYGELFDDFDLIVANCKRFNPPNTEPIWHALTMERAWRSEWEKASKLNYNLKRSLVSLMKTVMADGAAYPFLSSINLIIDQVPNYYDIIREGDERDLGTIKKNLEADAYSTIEALEADVGQMLRNCFAYNPPDTPVHRSGQELQKLFQAGVARIKAESAKGKKRAGDKGGGGAVKKQKM